MNIESTQSMISYRRIVEYWSNRRVTDHALLTMQDAKIIAGFYGSDERGTTPNMARFTLDKNYSVTQIMTEIESMIQAWVTDWSNGTVDGQFAYTVVGDLTTLRNFVWSMHGIFD